MKTHQNNYFDEILEKEKPIKSETQETRPYPQETRIEGKYHKIGKISSSVILHSEHDNKIAKEITKKREIFIDASFLLNDPKHYEDTFTQSDIQYELYRPSDFLTVAQIKLFSECKLTGYYGIGVMTQDHFLDVLSALSTQEDLVKRLFKQNKSSGLGLYQICLNNDGKWIQVNVDDQIPFSSSSNSFLGIFPLNRDDNSEPDLWAFLLEKAYAKLLGGYHKLSSIGLTECLRDLTGAPCKVVKIRKLIYGDKPPPKPKPDLLKPKERGSIDQFSRSTFGRFSNSLNPALDLQGVDRGRHTWDSSIEGTEKLFKLLKNGLLNGNIVMAANLNSINRGSLAVFKGSRIFEKHSDIEKGRAYCVVQVYQISEELRLIQLKTPTGVKNNFKGNWTKDSENWDHYEEMKQTLCKEDDNDEYFWVSIGELIEKFEDVVISEIEPGFNQNSIILKEYTNEVNRGMATGIVKFKVWKDGFYHICLNQGKNSLGVMNQLEFTLVQINQKRGKKTIQEENLFKFIDHSEGVKKSLTISSKLPEGEYIGLVRSYLHPKLVNSRLKYPPLNLSTYGYSTCSLAFLQTEIPDALPPLFATMNELAWRSYINKSENLLSASLILSKHPSDVTSNEFPVEIMNKEGEKEELTIEAENHLLEGTRVNIFRFKFGNISSLNKHYDGYFEAELSYNSNFFTFEGGEIYESEILDLEQYNEGIETVLVRTPKLDSENSAVILLKRKYHDSVIQEELGDKFQLEIKDVQFVNYDPEGDNEIFLRLENVEMMVVDPKLVREQSPIETSFETSPVKTKGFLQAKIPEKNIEFLSKCLNSLSKNFKNFMDENQYESKILSMVDDERLAQIQEILSLEINCWVKMLERISLSLVNFSGECLRRSMTANSNAYKFRQIHLQKIMKLGTKIIETRDEMISKCMEFRMKNLAQNLSNNWILLEADNLSKTENFTSPNPSIYKMNREENIVHKGGSIGFRLGGSKGSFFGDIVSELKHIGNEKESDSSSFFNSSEKRATAKILSFCKNGIKTEKVESEKSIRGNFLYQNKLNDTDEKKNGEDFNKKILFKEEVDLYQTDPAPIDFFKNYQEDKHLHFSNVQEDEEETKGTEETYPILDSDQLYNSSQSQKLNSPNFEQRRVLDVESPEVYPAVKRFEPEKVEEIQIEKKFHESYHVTIQSKVSEKNIEIEEIRENELQESSNKKRKKVDNFLTQGFASRTQPVIASRPQVKRAQVRLPRQIRDNQKNLMNKKFRNNFLSSFSHFPEKENKSEIEENDQKKPLVNHSLIKKKITVRDSEEDKKNTPEYLKRKKRGAFEFFSQHTQDQKLDQDEQDRVDKIVNRFKNQNIEKKKNFRKFNIEDFKKKINYYGPKKSNDQVRKVLKYTSIGSQKPVKKGLNFYPSSNNFGESRRHLKKFSNSFHLSSPQKKEIPQNKPPLNKFHFNANTKKWQSKPSKKRVRRSNSLMIPTAPKTNDYQGLKFHKPVKRAVSRPKSINMVGRVKPNTGSYLVHKSSKSFQQPFIPSNVISPRYNASTTPRFGQGGLIVRNSFHFGNAPVRQKRCSNGMRLSRHVLKRPMIVKSMRRSVGNKSAGALFGFY